MRLRGAKVIQNFAFPNQILFGAGALQSLPDKLKKLDCARPLLVTDQGLVACGLAGRVEETIRQAGLEPMVFDKVDANPTEENAEQGLLAYSNNACDGIVGLGGGSSLDTAKAIKLKVDHSLPLAEYDIEHQGWKKMVNPMPPMIAIATTAGTGSDVARGALIIVRPAGAKVAIVGPALYPDATIADPELTFDLPPHLTAGTGMDAFTHCIEEYLAPKYNPIIDGMALEGIRLCATSLKRACEEGGNLEARSDMMIAAMMGGMGFIKGLGVVHSLSHPVGSVVGGHHGTTNAIFLPACLEFNQPSAPSKYRALAHSVGIPAYNLSDEECGNAMIEFVRELNVSLDIPSNLSVFGATRDHIAEMLPMCVADHCHLTNPRACSEEDFRSLLEVHIPE
jgi:4-hydroxybutyrate dehydrogenase